jgi:GTPase SAR1 family protein
MLTVELLSTKFSELLDEIIIKFKGKTLAVLGARGVGKTHLIKFLTTGSLSTEYRQTSSPARTSSRRFPLKELSLNVKATLDLPGSEDFYGEWKPLHDKADIVLYLLRADRLIVGDRTFEDRARKDIQQISGWLEARSSRPDFFIIGTHCDLDPEFQSSTSSGRFGDYCDKFRRLQIVKELVDRAGGTQRTKVVLGSMKTVEDTEVLVYQVFTQLAS